ncbi:MAG: hypothetical protein ACPHVK_09300, partial [Akkermansiaceae bacterium]
MTDHTREPSSTRDCSAFGFGVSVHTDGVHCAHRFRSCVRVKEFINLGSRFLSCLILVVAFFAMQSEISANQGQGNGNGNGNGNGRKNIKAGGSASLDDLNVSSGVSVNDIDNDGTLSLATDGEDVELAGTISGSGTIIKQNNGKLKLTGDNSFQGNMEVVAGILELATPGKLGNGNFNGAISLGADGQIRFNTGA